MTALYTLLGLFVYIILGVGWAFLCWTSFVKTEVANYEIERQRFLRFHRIAAKEVPDFLKYEWRRYVEQNPRLQIPPDPQDHQDRLALNMGLWPLSIVFLVLGRLYKLTIQRLITEYMRSLNSKLQTVRKDLDT